MYGTCKTIVENPELGQPFREIKKVISISIMYFNIGSGQDYLYHGKTEFIGVHTGEILEVKHIRKITDTNNRVVRTVETKPDVYPEYYLIEVARFENVIQEDVDEWVYFFKNEKIEDNFHSKNIQKAREKLRLIKMSEQERKVYEKYLINLVSEKDAIETARNEGEAAGHAKGMAKGRAEGEQIGKVKSKIESLIEALEELGPIPDSLHEKIQSQQDLTTLKQWFKTAIKAGTIEDFIKQITD